MSLTSRFTAPDTRCLEKLEISTASEFDVKARFRETIPMVKFCHASIPGPTRLPDPNRFPGRETQDWDSLPDFFLNRSGTCGHGPHLIT